MKSLANFSAVEELRLLGVGLDYGKTHALTIGLNTLADTHSLLQNLVIVDRIFNQESAKLLLTVIRNNPELNHVKLWVDPKNMGAIRALEQAAKDLIARGVEIKISQLGSTR